LISFLLFIFLFNYDIYIKFMLFAKNLFNIIVPSIYMSLKNKDLDNIKKYYNIQSINNKDRFNKFCSINLE
jgi:hypothetical protein